MEMNDVFKVIEDFFSEQMLVNSILGKHQGKFKAAYSIVKGDIDLLEKDEDFKSTEEQFEKVRQTIKDARNIVMEEPITPKVQQFFKVWCELIINWNNNTFRRNKLGRDSMFVIRMIEQHYTVIEAIEVLKVLNKKFKDTKSWNPPAFEIAPHYLNYLEK